MNIDAAILHGYPPQYPFLRFWGLGRGVGDATSILSEQVSDQTNPFLTPAYYATVAADNNNECDVDPSSPACAVWQQIQAPTIEQTNENATELDLANYCEQNAFNVSQFGDAADTTSCSGSQPVASVVAQAAAQATQAPSWQSTTPANPAATKPASTPAPPTPVAVPAAVIPTITQAQISAAATSPPVPAGAVAVAPVTPVTPPSAAASSSTSTSTSSTGFDLTSIENWFTETSIDGIPNWALVAAGVAALFILPRLMGGRR
jgi:hypothetical protein